MMNYILQQIYESILYTIYRLQYINTSSVITFGGCKIRIGFHNRIPVSILFKHHFHFLEHLKGEMQLLIMFEE